MPLTQSIKEIIRRPIFLILSALLFITPLVMVNDTNELFEFPKAFFVYFLGTVVFSIGLTALVIKKRKIFWPSYAVLLFLITNLISTIFSSHVYTSFWGYYTRFNDGLLSILIFIAIYFVCLNWSNEWSVQNLLKISALTIFPISMIGVMQHYAIGADYEQIERVYSTFGQPNWLAQYLVMVLPVVLYFFATGFWIFWGIVFALGFACLWFSYSMSGILGFAVMSVVFFWIFYYKKNFRSGSLVKIVILYLLCLVFALFNLGLYKAKIHDALKDFGKRAESIVKVYAQEGGYKLSDPGFIRLGLWDGSFKLFLSSQKIFTIGTGPETFPYAFQPFRPLSLNYSSEWDYVFNKPHNYYLEVMTETGILGFLAFIYLVFHTLKKMPYYLLPGIAGFLVTNIFGWPVVATSLLFWVWLGCFERARP